MVIDDKGGEKQRYKWNKDISDKGGEIVHKDKWKDNTKGKRNKDTSDRGELGIRGEIW